MWTLSMLLVSMRTKWLSHKIKLIYMMYIMYLKLYFYRNLLNHLRIQIQWRGMYYAIFSIKHLLQMMMELLYRLCYLIHIWLKMLIESMVHLMLELLHKNLLFLLFNRKLSKLCSLLCLSKYRILLLILVQSMYRKPLK